MSHVSCDNRSASNAGITGKIPTCSGATSLQKLYENHKKLSQKLILNKIIYVHVFSTTLRDLSDNKLEGGIPKELGFVPTLLQTL